MKSIRIISVLLALILSISGQLFAIPHHSAGDAKWRTEIDLVVSPSETISEPLNVAGINVEINTTVQKAMRLAAIRAKTGGWFQQSVQIVAADAELGGTFDQEVTCYAARAGLTGTFNRDVTVKAARIVLDSTVVIKGNFTYTAAAIEGLDRATIEGTVSSVPFDVPEERDELRERDFQRGLTATIVLAWFLSLAAITVTALVMHTLFPNPYASVTATIAASPSAALGVGLVVLVAAPPTIIVMLATIIGIPIALIAGMGYLAALYAGQVFSARWLGRIVMSRFRGEEATPGFFREFFPGILTIRLAGLIPFIGWLFGFIMTLIGLGGIWLTAWHGFRARRRSPFIGE